MSKTAQLPHEAVKGRDDSSDIIIVISLLKNRVEGGCGSVIHSRVLAG